MATTPHDGAGTTFVFNGDDYTVTAITYTLSDTAGGADQIDVSHLGQTTGATVLSLARPLKGTAGGDTGKEVSIDFIGSSPIVGGTSGTLTITGGIAISSTGATCTQSSLSLKVNDVVTGSATFKFV